MSAPGKKPVMSDEERELRQSAANDFADFYAPTCLKVLAKAGEIQPLVLNYAQRYIHARLEAQRKKTGKVRAVILKGRQMGCSTLIEGRFYHKVTHRRGVKAFILTHLSDATNNLFNMVDRFHTNMNPLLRPHTGSSNARELSFDLLDSGYRVGTAGSAAVGRSETLQYFHGSEVAFWENADSITTGVMQAIPNESGTEVILESTANGLGNYFAQACADARAGKGEFIFIFVPWFWDPGYRLPVPEGFELTKDEQDYFDAYHDIGLIDLSQMVWKRAKEIELKEAWKFTQEYPATPEEAFQASGEGCYIKPLKVMKARKAHIEPFRGIPIIIGIDPAKGGRDKTSVIDRQGRRAGGNVFTQWSDANVTTLVGKTIKLIEAIKPKKVVIDATEGTGGSMVDLLVEKGYGKIVQAVKFSNSAIDEENYLNRRAEMWALMKEWIESENGADLPDDDGMQAELCAAVWGDGATRHNSRGQLQIESKEHIIKRLKHSPDKADSLACTFGFTMEPSSMTMLPITPPTAPADASAGY
jgi:hypothetical protein